MTVRLQRIGDYVEALDNESAMVLSDDLGCTATKRGDNIRCGFPYQYVDEYLRELRRFSHDVERAPDGI